MSTTLIFNDKKNFDFDLIDEETKVDILCNLRNIADAIANEKSTDNIVNLKYYESWVCEQEPNEPIDLFYYCQSNLDSFLNLTLSKLQSSLN